MEDVGLCNVYRRHVHLPVLLRALQYAGGVHRHALGAVLGVRRRFPHSGGVLLRLDHQEAALHMAQSAVCTALSSGFIFRCQKASVVPHGS